VLNNPLVLIDPDGHASELPCNFGGTGPCIGTYCRNENNWLFGFSVLHIDSNRIFWISVPQAARSSLAYLAELEARRYSHSRRHHAARTLERLLISSNAC
jgi:hypothetical protein